MLPIFRFFADPVRGKKSNKGKKSNIEIDRFSQLFDSFQILNDTKMPEFQTKNGSFVILNFPEQPFSGNPINSEKPLKIPQSGSSSPQDQYTPHIERKRKTLYCVSYKQ